MSQQAPESASGDARSVHDRVEEIIERIRPAIQMDGGDVELVRITDENVVLVRLHGACVGCPSANMTLQMGIERNVREKVPEIVGVEQVP
ncbi:Fe/S biogenesis protein NfuA [Poriferisphaera corsica]|uniref:Fe/S biogenesis protein NfuA n=1 Tax=Poriferisphaera corsica TaxID=2528020 RepID=A0A517YQU4_9BACT|nr:NifU family protein [Poriferisphaera corsica]QDU32575.1 Fe/S biogenesis protein NfuA [Poriferisphaera corsica]